MRATRSLSKNDIIAFRNLPDEDLRASILVMLDEATDAVGNAMNDRETLGLAAVKLEVLRSWGLDRHGMTTFAMYISKQAALLSNSEFPHSDKYRAQLSALHMELETAAKLLREADGHAGGQAAARTGPKKFATAEEQIEHLKQVTARDWAKGGRIYPAKLNAHATEALRHDVTGMIEYLSSLSFATLQRVHAVCCERDGATMPEAQARYFGSTSDTTKLLIRACIQTTPPTTDKPPSLEVDQNVDRVMERFTAMHVKHIEGFRGPTHF